MINCYKILFFQVSFNDIYSVSLRKKINFFSLFIQKSWILDNFVKLNAIKKLFYQYYIYVYGIGAYIHFSLMGDS